MNETFMLILLTEFDCSVRIHDFVFDLYRLDKPKVIELDNHSNHTLHIFPFGGGIPFALPLKKPTNNTFQSESAYVFCETKQYFVLLQCEKQSSRMLGTRQTELQWNHEKPILTYHTYENQSLFCIFLNNLSIEASLPFAVQTLFHFPFGNALALVCEGKNQKALLLTDGKTPNMELFLCDLIGYDDNRIQLYRSNQTLCQHATLTTITQEGGALHEESKLVFERGTPNFAFSNHLIPLAMMQCLQLNDNKTATHFCTLSMQKQLESQTFQSFLSNVEHIFALPCPENRFLYGIVLPSHATRILEIELFENKVNQVFWVD